MAARLLMGRQLHHMSPLSSLRCACTLRETVRAARKRVRSSRESPRASAATHTQRERERGEWQHASSWDGSCITCLLSLLCHACACTLRETVGAARKRDGYGAAERACGPLQPHTRRERERGEWQHASSWDGRCITCLLSPLCHACACTLRETVGAARKRDGYGAAERACGPLQPHTRRERERERGEWQHASSWDGSCITCLLSPLCHACACTLRETVGAARKRDGYGAAERACGPLQPHTRRERERER